MVSGRSTRSFQNLSPLDLLCTTHSYVLMLVVSVFEVDRARLDSSKNHDSFLALPVQIIEVTNLRRLAIHLFLDLLDLLIKPFDFRLYLRSWIRV